MLRSQFIYFIPIATTIIASAFSTIVLRRYRERGGTHLLWWGVGLILYGVGTLTEALTTVFGWNEWVFRAWYITGALCGGAPLAQGTVYLLMKRRTAHVLSALLITAILTGAVFVMLSPINEAMIDGHRLSGRALGWQWVRLISPFINTYAAVFLIGGAIVSAFRYRANPDKRNKYVGNILIAIGAILPGIGGTFTRMGHVEVLYVTEFVGLLLIYMGYRQNIGQAIIPRPVRQKSLLA
ncbi:MAG TPA: hypothetical protein VEB19_04875 [Gemmatimonadaceae bacterium]|nr:hypothetical protein [Gemmatimonadaceae bacterium]